MDDRSHRPLSIEGTPYALLRHLTLPVVAVTSSLDGRGNGMIANGAQRGSLVPTAPRISLYINKTNETHERVYRTGVLGIHLLCNDQWDLIYGLGFRSARDGADKLADIETKPGVTGIPMLVDCRASFECRVINAMDGGGATFFLADVVDVNEGRDGPIMMSDYFRDNLPPDRKQMYETLLVEAQERLLAMAPTISREPWPGPTALP